jgi:hypothetical protein
MGRIRDPKTNEVIEQVEKAFQQGRIGVRKHTERRVSRVNRKPFG